MPTLSSIILASNAFYLDVIIDELASVGRIHPEASQAYQLEKLFAAKVSAGGEMILFQDELESMKDALGAIDELTKKGLILIGIEGERFFYRWIGPRGIPYYPQG